MWEFQMNVTIVNKKKKRGYLHISLSTYRTQIATKYFLTIKYCIDNLQHMYVAVNMFNFLSFCQQKNENLVV